MTAVELAGVGFAAFVLPHVLAEAIGAFRRRLAGAPASRSIAEHQDWRDCD